MDIFIYKAKSIALLGETLRAVSSEHPCVGVHYCLPDPVDISCRVWMLFFRMFSPKTRNQILTKFFLEFRCSVPRMNRKPQWSLVIWFFRITVNLYYEKHISFNWTVNAFMCRTLFRLYNDWAQEINHFGSSHCFYHFKIEVLSLLTSFPKIRFPS